LAPRLNLAPSWCDFFLIFLPEQVSLFAGTPWQKKPLGWLGHQCGWWEGTGSIYFYIDSFLLGLFLFRFHSSEVQNAIEFARKNQVGKIRIWCLRVRPRRRGSGTGKNTRGTQGVGDQGIVGSAI